jgi:hypothetical protein
LQLLPTRSLVKLIFNAEDIWTLLKINFRFGGDLEITPSGSARYPYGWRSSEGVKRRSFEVALTSNGSVPASCATSVFAILDLAVGRTFSNGTLIPQTEERVQAVGSNVQVNADGDVYFQNSIKCDCKSDPLGLPPVTLLPPGVCLQAPDFSGRRCFSLTGNDGLSVGDVCVKINTEEYVIEVTVRVYSGWTLIEGKLWVGNDPMNAPPLLDNVTFPYNWVSPSSKKQWVEVIDLPNGAVCKDRSAFKMFGKALVKVARMQTNTSLLGSLEHVASAQSLTVNSSTSSDGLFDVTFVGICDVNSGVASAKAMGRGGENSLDPYPIISTLLGKECWPLLTVSLNQVGMVCLEVAGDPPFLEVTFQTEGIFRLVDTKLWVGTYISGAPIFKDIDSSFPYFWCEPTGATRWKVEVKLNETEWCIEDNSSTVFYIAEAKVGRIFANGTVIPGTDESASVGRVAIGGATASSPISNFTVMCKTRASAHISSSLPLRACLDTRDPSGKICYSLQTSQGIRAGVVCLSVVQGHETLLHARFTSEVSLSLVKAHFWAGLKLESIPMSYKNSSVSPDLTSFPAFWSNSSGRPYWDANLDVDLSSICQRGDRFKFYVVAHATVERVSLDGMQMPHTRQTVYAKNSPGPHPFGGWFEVPVKCDCPKKGDGEEKKKGDLTPATTEPSHEVCFASPHGTVKRCFTLLVAGRAPGGSVCLELVDRPPRLGGAALQVTFNAIADAWGILKSIIWTGLDLKDAPMVDVRNATKEQFPIFRYNSSADQWWSYDMPLNVTDNCANNQVEFEVFVLAQSVVTRVDKKGRIIQPMTKHSAIAVDPEWTPLNPALKKGFGLKVQCNCKYGKSRRERELEIYPHHQQTFRN